MDASLQSYQFGEFTIDYVSGCVLRGGEEIKLRPKLFDTLKYLVERPGRLISKQELMKAVWPDSFVTEDSLVQCVLELRRALDDHGQQLLKTVPRRGYLFAANVTRHAPSRDRGLSVDERVIPEHDAGVSRTPDRNRKSAPTPRTSLIGRQQELASAQRLLLRPDVRLVTLTGAGGAGKTRLSIALAAAVANHFIAGVQYVPLASITDASLVSIAVSESLGIHQVANRPVTRLMNEQLPSSGPFLLVLDNFEQVLTAAAFVSEALEECSQLKILVTSRARLHVYGEHEFPIASLATNAAIELFGQRAAAVRPGFSITGDIASTVEDICARLDGLPLTIELAAARIKVLSPKEILDRLQNSLSLLTGGALDLPERQKTLRNTINWSYGLLKDPEARLFRRMSVFTGGCTLEGAEAVCDTGGDLGIDVFDGLSSLVDQNLVQSTDDEGGNRRFSMLQTIREYAMECLMASGQHAAVKRAQAAYCLVVAEEGNPDLNSNERAGWLAQCDSEIDNFRSALDWLVEGRVVEWALRMSMALFRFWDTREHLTEGRSRLEAIFVLAGSDFSKERARIALFIGALATAQGDYSGAENFLGLGLSLNEDLGNELGTAASLNALGIAARDRGDYLAAQTYLERSLACWRVLSDPLAMARCLHNLANVLKVRGDFPRSRWLLQEAADKFDEFGDRVGCAWCISQRGDVERSQGRKERARDCYQRALSVFREIGDPWGTGRSLTDLAYIDSSEGNHSGANAACREALEIFYALGHRRGIARTIEACACLAAAQEKNGRAWVLSAGAAHLRQMIGAPLHPTEQEMLDQMLRDARESLDESRSRQLWDMGFAMSMDEAIRYCFDETRAAATV